eukprot:365341-Pleurochrysis_carterae.AAC.1
MPCSLACNASSTRSGRSSAAGAWFLRKEEGMPSGSTQSASVAMSTLSKSETGPSSSTFHREARAVVKEEYSDVGPSSE